MGDWKPPPYKPGREFKNVYLGKPVPPEETGSRYVERRLKELDMEKRGVVTDDEKTKTAGRDKKCPKCGAELNEHNYCTNCGTEPFEKDPNGSSEEE